MYKRARTQHSNSHPPNWGAFLFLMYQRELDKVSFPGCGTFLQRLRTYLLPFNVGEQILQRKFFFL